MKFSIGYNQEIDFLNLLNKYKKNIEAVYFPIPAKYATSGRYGKKENNYNKKIISICKSLNIKSLLLLNATCSGETGLEKKPFSKTINYIKKLKDCGLTGVVVTNPVYINEIRKQLRGILIESSVNCYVKTVEHALYLKNLGVDIITIDRDINRDIPLIKKIKKATGLKVRIMLNEGCLKDCPYRKMHYNSISHGGLKGIPIDGICFDRYCWKVLFDDPKKILRSPFVPPDQLRRYVGVVDYFKLSTRVFSVSAIEFCLNAYISGDFSGNLQDILDSPALYYFDYIDYGVLKKSGFFKKMQKCQDYCLECGLCNKWLRGAVVIKDQYLSGEEKKEELKKAIIIFSRALKYPMKGNNLYIKLGKVFFKLRHYKKAIKAFNFAKEMDFETVDLHSLLANCYKKLGQYTKSKR